MNNQRGSQRLTLDAIQRWRELEYGIFLHFGMSTFDGIELSPGDRPSTDYAPTELDVDQWVATAVEAGMRYAVLTAKHVSGHCLWPSESTDYHVGTSRNTTDVVGAFVRACRQHKIMPGLYYCSWDNHHRFGSNPPDFVTRAYMGFQRSQLMELARNYGEIGEFWIDIPTALPRFFRQELYEMLAELQPQAIIVMNHGITNGSKLNVANAWPTDVMTIERFLPSSRHGYDPWFDVEGEPYFLSGEVCDPIGQEWFFHDHDEPRSVDELLGMLLICRERGVNLLLDVPPDKTGVIPQSSVETLRDLRAAVSSRTACLP